MRLGWNSNSRYPLPKLGVGTCERAEYNSFVGNSRMLTRGLAKRPEYISMHVMDSFGLVICAHDLVFCHS